MDFGKQIRKFNILPNICYLYLFFSQQHVQASGNSLCYQTGIFKEIVVTSYCFLVFFLFFFCKFINEQQKFKKKKKKNLRQYYNNCIILEQKVNTLQPFNFFLFICFIKCSIRFHFNRGYRISSNKQPRRLLNLETIRYCTYWRAALIRGRHLFQSQGNEKY